MFINTIIVNDGFEIHVRFVKTKEEFEHTIPIELVTDFDQNGEAIGVEIINLTHVGGPNALPVEKASCEGISVKFSYDADVDTAYLRFKKGRSIEQRAVDGWLEINTSGRLVGIKAKLKI